LRCMEIFHKLALDTLSQLLQNTKLCFLEELQETLANTV
jgi:hypothetical protein